MEELVNDMVGTSLSAALSQVDKLVTTYGEEAVSLALLVVQLRSIGELIISLIAFACVLTSFFVIIPYAKKVWDNDPSEEGDCQSSTVLICAVTPILTIGSLIFFFRTSFLDPVVWASSFGFPEIEVARSLLEKVL
jgi:hypothetical protein